MNEWISIEDRLPEDDVRVLLMTEKGFSVGAADHHDNVGVSWRIGNSMIAWDYEYNLDDLEVTHWMPLPEPPR